MATVAAMGASDQVAYVRAVNDAVTRYREELSSPAPAEGEPPEVAQAREAVPVLRMLASMGASTQVQVGAAAALPSSDYRLVTQVLAYRGFATALEQFASRMVERSTWVDEAFEHWYALAVHGPGEPLGDEGWWSQWWDQCPKDRRADARDAVEQAARQAARRVSAEGANRVALTHVRSGSAYSPVLASAVAKVSSPDAIEHLYRAGVAPGTPAQKASWAEIAVQHPAVPVWIANDVLARAAQQRLGHDPDMERQRRLVRAAAGAYRADLDYPVALLLADPARWWVLLVEQAFGQSGPTGQGPRDREWARLVMSQIEMEIEERTEALAADPCPAADVAPGVAPGGVVDDVFVDGHPVATRVPFVERLMWIAENGTAPGFGEVLVAAAQWPDVRVRRRVAKNPQVPQDLVMQMLNDADRWVRHNAGLRFLDALGATV